MCDKKSRQKQEQKTGIALARSIAVDDLAWGERKKPDLSVRLSVVSDQAGY